MSMPSVSAAPLPEQAGPVLADRNASTAPDSEDAARRAAKRTRLVLLTLGPYAANVVLLAAASTVGAIAPAQIAVYTLLALLVVLPFVALARSTAAAAIDSADFTMLQMLAASIPAAYAMFSLEDTASRATFLMTVLTPLLFGITNLNATRYAIVAVWYVLGYFALLGAFALWAPHLSQPGPDLLLGFALLLIVLQVSLLGGLIFRLRGNLRQRSAELAVALTRISEMAHRDELTQLPNRRALVQALETHLTQGAAARPMSVCLLDVDHFKRVNDQWGHDAGDAVLTSTAAALAGAVRGSDFVGRWGGEEFLILMPNCDAEDARNAAERVREAVEAIDLASVGAGLSVTASLGVAQWLPGETGTQVVARADEALYEAKAHGRNQVRVTEPTCG